MTLFLICVYRDKVNVKLGNALFIIADLGAYLCWNIAQAQKGWLDDGFMTLENISPYIATIIPLTIFMGPKTKKFALAAIAFLHAGMFAALFISPEYVVLFDYSTEANFVYASEATFHMIAALFGIYLILTHQVECSFGNWLRSIAFMFASITFGVILNLILDTDCFNMNPNHYGIYMLDIFKDYETTRLAYYLGVFLVLTLGMQLGSGFDKLLSKLKKQYAVMVYNHDHRAELHKEEDKKDTKE